MNNLTPFQQKFKNLCTYLGKNNKALYGALTIALSKGIMRPTFTMMDKKQEINSRKYTAFREGFTGAVALVSYLITDKLVNKLAKHIAEKTNHINELPKMKSTLSLIGVSLTALFVIPAVCNAGTKPLMNAIFNNHEKLPPKKNTNPINFQGYGYAPQYHFKNFYNSGMKIGGM